MIIAKKVSIIITTHNREKLLPRAINSVLAQTYDNLEIIIIDDASIDNTEKIIKKYIDKNPKIKYIKHKKSMGANVARNVGIKLASGLFIAGLDDDDAFHPKRIELLVKNYSDDYSLVTSNDIMVNNSGYKKTTTKPKTITLEKMLNANIIGNQVLIKRERLLALDGFDEALTASQDYDMWLRVVEKYGKALVVQKGLQYIYISSTTRRISSIGNKKFSGYFNFYKKHKKLFSKKNRKQQLARMYKTRNKKMSFYTLLVLFSPYTVKEQIKLLIKSLR
jgi:glycosyltransferase involved in cell wall biosynthesis